MEGILARMRNPCRGRGKVATVSRFILPCDGMPLGSGPSRAVTVPSTTNLNWCLGISGLLPASPRASMVHLAVEVSNVDAMLSRISSSLCDG